MLLSCTGPRRDLPALFPDLILSPEFAEGFEIRGNGSQIQIVLKEQGTITRTVVLRAPASRIACLSTTHLALFDAIGEASRIRALGYVHLVHDSAMKSLIGKHRIANLTTGDDVDREVMLSAEPDLFLTYPYQSGPLDWYEEKGIPVLPVAEYLESHPLGRAEWILVAGAASGQLEKARETFSGIRSRYLAIRQSVDSVRLNSGDSPQVLLTSRESGIWHAPPGNSAIAMLIRHAGGKYLLEDRVAAGNIELDRELLIAMSAGISCWGELVRTDGEPSFAGTEKSYPFLRNVEAFRNRRGFYCNTSRADYFGKAVIEPDVLLADLAVIFHPGILPARRPVYFHPLPAE
jgi:iron complex transport system substrate-binding protein